LAADIEFDPTMPLLLEWSVEKGLVNEMGVGGVKGSHRIKVCEALDLVTFLTGLLNSCLRLVGAEGTQQIFVLMSNYQKT
jgi:hypothetical protein